MARKSIIRQRQAEVVRQALETAALEECERSGYPNLQIRAIVKRAGCAQGTFYLYFKDKKDLFRQLLRRHASELRRQIEGGYERATTLEERIRIPAEVLFGFVERNRPAFNLMFREGWLSDPDFAGLFREILDRAVGDVVRGLEQARDAGLVEHVEGAATRITAVAMLGSLWFLALQQWGRHGMSKARITEVYVTTWLRALRAPSLA